MVDGQRSEVLVSTPPGESGTERSSTRLSARREALNEMFAACARELLEGYAASVTPLVPEVDKRAFDGWAARIQFTGEQLHGTIWLRVSRTLSQATLCAASGRGSVSEHLLPDWSGELANQLLGRLKNKVRPFAVSFELLVPQVFVESEESPLSPKGVCLRWGGQSGEFWCWLDATLAPDTQFVVDETIVPVEEGELILF